MHRDKQMDAIATNRLLIEELPTEDFGALQYVAEGTVPDAKKSIVIVAKDGNEIVGRIMLLNLAHIEGTWVAPQHRGGTIGWRMIRMIEKAAQRIGITKLFAYTDTDQNGEYVERLGYRKTNFVVWVKEL